MFVSIFTTGVGLIVSLLTVLAIPNSEPHITTFTGLAGIAAMFLGCAGMYWHEKE